MKQFLAVLAAALLVTGIYAMTAGAGHQNGVSPAKFKKLAKQVTKLKTQVRQIEGTLSCFTSVLPVSQYSGFQIVGGTTTALDLRRAATDQVAYLLTIDPACVQGGAPSLFKQLHGLK